MAERSLLKYLCSTMGSLRGEVDSLSTAFPKVYHIVRFGFLGSCSKKALRGAVRAEHTYSGTSCGPEAVETKTMTVALPHRV